MLFRRCTNRRLLVAVSLLMVGTANGRVTKPTSAQAPTVNGQSATLLPDGRWLLLGGVGVEGMVALLDPVSGERMVLPSQPGRPRAWHSATLLADGAVLIAGGLDADGEAVTTVERFELGTQFV
jgi:hypothetical protein